MLRKILIANRGEIACRVIRTARRMGIATVAVYSDADARSPHVAMADEAVHIGPSPASESYLAAEKIIAACKSAGADAVHPGYGFLSERASFVEALEAEGIAFIGPPASAIAAMGDKIESKRIAAAAGVNVVPGFVGEVPDTQFALDIANRIGYPVMLKASAGGGGKGMRLAYCEQDVREGFGATQREALASFGDDRLLLEKFIENPRHIEIQVLGDKHGNMVHLGERECSIQRRHQKVVEEAPSPFVTPEMREAMGAQAIALAKAVGYHSAGTVELIVSGSGETEASFYFLEMNTRLQVEHPVTEEVTGIDLVEQMIRIAAGEKLAFSQDDVTFDGHAIETRVYAEDPYRNFLPSTGRLVRYRPPAGSFETSSQPAASISPQDERNGAPACSAPRVRTDDGVTEGGEVSIHYDPMIAKLITWAPSREEAADLQVQALDEFRIEGPGHNVDFLSALMQHPRFREGRLTTGFIAEEYPEGFAGAPVSPSLRRGIAAIAGIIATIDADRARRIAGQLNGSPAAPGDWQVSFGGESHSVSLEEEAILVDGQEVDIAFEYTPGDAVIRAELDGEPLTLQVARRRMGYVITTRGCRHDVRLINARYARHAAHMIESAPPDLSRLLICPMPGLLTALHVAEGDQVEAGQPLATVEAMKMENILRAQRAGTVTAVHTAQGESLAANTVIMEIE